MKLLNRFAYWLYWKTKKEKQSKTDIASLYGMKLMQSDFIPPDTIIVGTERYKDFRMEFEGVAIKMKV